MGGCVRCGRACVEVPCGRPGLLLHARWAAVETHQAEGQDLPDVKAAYSSMHPAAHHYPNCPACCPGCTAKAGSSFYTERGASCEQDAECCEGLACVDRGEHTCACCPLDTLACLPKCVTITVRMRASVLAQDTGCHASQPALGRGRCTGMAALCPVMAIVVLCLLISC